MRMKPIFVVLVIISYGLMIYTFSLGWRYHEGHERVQAALVAGKTVDPADAETIGNLIPHHFVWGLVTGVFVCGIHSLVLTYFLGTGKAIKEQMELKAWESTEYDRWKKLMARSVLPSCIGIILIVCMAFSGGFTMIRMLSPTMHLVIAAGGLLLQAPVHAWQLFIIMENGKLMDHVVDRLGGDNLKLTL